MVFGFRVSYHPTQNPRQPPVCPCAKCFSGAGEEQALREACQCPARSVGTQASDKAGLRRFAFALGRRRSADSMASDMRPLREVLDEDKL